MILATSVVDGHELTDFMVEMLQPLITDPDDFRLVIVDNNSVEPYLEKNYEHSKFKVDVMRNSSNTGFYFPLIQLHGKYQDELIGLIHNDLALYEVGWDVRMANYFKADPLLGLVGLTGSNEIDSLGGRGGGTMCFFRGSTVNIPNLGQVKGQSQDAGARITDLRPSACLDSLFMMFRRDVIPSLMTDFDHWKDITLAHFYDRIWPIRTIEAGYHVATMGVECDHLGGMTCVANTRYRDDCIKWLDSRGLTYENPETEMYLIAERRYLGEYRESKHFIPCKVDANYGIQHLYKA